LFRAITKKGGEVMTCASFIPFLVVIVFIILDIITGLVKAFYNNTYSSSEMRKGGLRKIGIFLSVVLCYIVEVCLPYLNITINIPITIIAAAYLAFMEITSIIENLSALNPNIKDFLESIINKIKGGSKDESK
jgi:toxin secretion/phage lysis holin